MKKLLGIATTIALAMALAGCTQQEQAVDEGPDYADDEAMVAIADGLEARFDIADSITDDVSNEEYFELLESAVQAEIDAVSPFRDRQFENPEMQEDVLAYANMLDDSMEQITGRTSDEIDLEFLDDYNVLYDERLVALRELSESYGLMLDDAHQEEFERMLREGDKVQQTKMAEEAAEKLVSKTKFEAETDEFGMVTYVATVENDTEFDFGSFGMIVALYDDEGVKVEETYANTSSWPSGEKVRFEAFPMNDASEIKVSLDYYELAEE